MALVVESMRYPMQPAENYRLQELKHKAPSQAEGYLHSQVAENCRPLCPKVDHYWFKVAHNYETLALQVRLFLRGVRLLDSQRGSGARHLEAEICVASGSRDLHG